MADATLPEPPPEPPVPPDPTAAEQQKKTGGDFNRLSKEVLADLLGKRGVLQDAPEWWNHRLLFAHSHGAITNEQLERSLSCSTRVVKRYLWSITSDITVRSRLRTYSIATTKLWHRLGAIVNMCAV